MPALNLFRLYPKQKENLIRHIEKRGLVHLETRSVRYRDRSFSLHLYFSTSPKKSYVKWIKQLQQVFKVPDKKIENYSAVMLISSKDFLYGASYGIAHFYVARFADVELGIAIASRILSSYSIKNSRSFGGRTRKTISTYDNISELGFDGGESVSFIKGKPADTRKWGKTVSCGQSIQLRKREFSPGNAHEVAMSLEETLLHEAVKTEIPRSMKVVDKPTIENLTEMLIADMENGNYMFAISEQQLSGVEFVFSDTYAYHILYRKGEVELDPNLTLKEVSSLVNKHFAGDYRSFLAADVEVREDGEPRYTSRVISFIDYVDGMGHHYLEQGEWYKFDLNYLRYLHSAVDLIPTQLAPEITSFDDVGYKSWLKEGNRSATEYYRERYLNSLLSERFGYENFDRNILKYDGLSVEFADLVREDELVFVKIGIPQKLNYVIDQSINSIKILQRLGFVLDVGGKKRNVKKITLWLFLERTEAIASLSAIHSLTFLMKLSDWRKEVLLSGGTPLVKVSYAPARK